MNIKDLKLMGSAGSLDDLKKMIVEKMYWSAVILTPLYSSRGNIFYSVANTKGITDYVVIKKSNGRCGIYYKR